MWEFPNGRVDEGNPVTGLADVIWEGYQVQIHAGNPLCIIYHAYTHFKIMEGVYACTMLKSSIKENTRWVGLNELNKYPMRKVDIIAIFHLSNLKAGFEQICCIILCILFVTIQSPMLIALYSAQVYE